MSKVAPLSKTTRARNPALPMPSNSLAIADSGARNPSWRLRFVPPQGCAYRKSNPAILMVQSAQDRTTDTRPAFSAAREIGASLFNDR
jgi:hypothetical protein